MKCLNFFSICLVFFLPFGPLVGSDDEWEDLEPLTNDFSEDLDSNEGNFSKRDDLAENYDKWLDSINPQDSREMGKAFMALIVSFSYGIHQAKDAALTITNEFSYPDSAWADAKKILYTLSIPAMGLSASAWEQSYGKAYWSIYKKMGPWNLKDQDEFQSLLEDEASYDESLNTAVERISFTFLQANLHETLNYAFNAQNDYFIHSKASLLGVIKLLRSEETPENSVYLRPVTVSLKKRVENLPDEPQPSNPYSLIESFQIWYESLPRLGG